MGLLQEFKGRGILDSDRIKNIELHMLNSSSNSSNSINSNQSDLCDRDNEKTNNNNSFLQHFLDNADIEIFDERRDETGKNQWQKLSEEGVQTTSSTKIGAIISHYGQKDFYVDQSCNVLLNMLSWSPEDKKKWRSFDSDIHSFVYNQGNDFENLVPLFFKHNFPEYLVKNWNNEKKGLFLKNYNNRSYNIYCRPDYFLYKLSNLSNLSNLTNSGQNNAKIVEGIIVEVKSSSSKTKRIDNYKYQLALQDMLIRCFYPNVLIKSCLLFNDCLIEYSREELVPLQKDIIKYIPMFWEDFRTGNYKKISVEEYIEFVKGDK